MPMTMREIPGFYYDEEKKRYFKVESSRTAPPTSAWSSDSVKKRKLENKEATAALRRLQLEKGLIKRSPLLRDPLVGGVYMHEHGSTRRGTPEASFAKGFVEKGSMPLKDVRWGSNSNLLHLCVVGADRKTGLGVAYATLDELLVFSTYIPRDRNGRVHRRLLAGYNTPRGNPYSELAVSQTSDIKFHKPSQSVLVSSRAPGHEMSLWSFKPAEAPTGMGRGTPMTPEWLLGADATGPGSAVVHLRIPGHSSKISDYQINVIAPGPPSSSSICAIGTNRGILHWDPERDPSWLAPSRNATTYAELYRDVFAIDFLSSNPAVLLAGGRPGHFSVKDVRDRNDDTRSLSKRLGSPITHIKSLDGRNVLVSGLKHDMAVYDLRMLRAAAPGRAFQRPTIDHILPAAQFPDYRNGPHVNIGLDIDVASGVVAAAHEDGSVALYSTRTGHRLSCPDVDKIRSHRGVIQSLQFETMPGDINPTLFVGIGSSLHAYSFGARHADDEA